MASKGRAKKKATCLVCFETKPLKTVGDCQHSFCVKCLRPILNRSDDTFRCPSCKAECRRPRNGVEGLADFTGNETAEAAINTVLPQEQSQGAKPEKTTIVIENTIVAKCHFCLHGGREVDAKDLCVQCGNLCFCAKCTDIHARNKATRNHVVVPLKIEGAQCARHNSVMNSYCVECGRAVCMMCVMFEHGDHTIEELEHAINTKVDEVKNVLEPQETRLTELERLEEELSWLKSVSPMVDRQDALIKDIEDHAQRCVDQIVRWKDGLKKQVKDNFKVIQQIPESLENVSNIVHALRETVEKARKIVDETRYDPTYLDQLAPLWRDLESVAQISGEVGGRELLNHLIQLDQARYHFCPDTITDSCGTIEGEETDADPGNGEFRLKEIFQHAMQVDAQDKAIQSVAVLGCTFAVAHPVRNGEPSHAISICEFPGIFTKTFTDHVYPLFDMSATPDGKIAVLSSGSREGIFCVKLFDPTAGYISSSPDIDLVQPLSLAVTADDKYVILYRDRQGQTQIKLLDKEAGVLDTCDIDSAKIQNPNKIAYGGQFVYVKGDHDTGLYKVKVTGLQRCHVRNYECLYLKDITATIWDEFVFADIDEGRLELDVYRNDSSEYPHIGGVTVHDHGQLWDITSRVSTRAGHTVITYGYSFKVYKHY